MTKSVKEKLPEYRHWHIKADDHGVLHCSLSHADRDVNVLSREVLEELGELLKSSLVKKAKALVFRSTKGKGFIAGAAVDQFKLDLSDLQPALDYVQLGQDTFSQLANLKIPTVALIHGFCLGGGLELALACRYRVLLSDPSNQLGLPEVQLGILPAWQGCVRLPRLIGAFRALPMILTGRKVRSVEAKRIGLVDAVVPKRHIERAVLYYALNSPKTYQMPWWHRLGNFRPFRDIWVYILKRKLKLSTNAEHYPAPFALLDNWREVGCSDSAFKAETRIVHHLLTVNKTALNLMRVFHLQNLLKQAGKSCKNEATRVHVVGGGTMGASIAIWCILHNKQVTLQDTNKKVLAQAVKQAYSLVKKRFKKPVLVQKIMDRLVPDPSGAGIQHADVLIEAVFEDIEVKKNVLKNLESKAKSDALIATNTSSIELALLAKALKKPDRLVGIHFFNPVHQMPLVELVKVPEHKDELIERTASFIQSINKLPLLVTSHPGFLVNRILMPYLIEAVVLLKEGIPAEVIDASATAFGLPVGPVELADWVGLDVCLHVSEHLHVSTGIKIPRLLKQKVAQGNLGRKTGQGFYSYKNGHVIKDNKPIDKTLIETLAGRLVMLLLNESARCLHAGVVETADQLDAGMIFGAGFPPFRGGPMRYAATLGFKKVHKTLKCLEEAHGARFKPCDYWSNVTQEKQA